MLYMASQFSV